MNSDFESLPVCADQLTASSNSETSFVPTPVSQNERNACDCDGDCQCGTKRTQGESCQLESSVESDDLTKIRGIGPATAELLRNSGITTFASLQAASPNRLQQILSNGDDKFKLIDSSRWTQQAKFATSSDWSGLKRWQHKNVVTTETVSTQSSVSSAATSSATSTGSKAADDLTRIYGIGSATAALLRESGITSFASLQATDQSRLQQILSNGGVKFNLVDPSYWTQQAKFAMDGDWSGLMVWQHKNVISTSERQSPSNSDNRTNASVATSSQRDDLTKILGIGPASQKLLRRNNIQSFEQVASMSSQELDEIFKQQSRFSMLDTSTWPQQAQAIIASDPELNEEASLLDELREIRDIASSSTPSVESATIDTPVTTNEQS